MTHIPPPPPSQEEPIESIKKCKKLLNSAAKIFADHDEYKPYLSRLHSDWDKNNCNDVYDVSINQSLAIRTPLFADYDTEFGDTKNECDQRSLSPEQMNFYFTGSLVGGPRKYLEEFIVQLDPNVCLGIRMGANFLSRFLIDLFFTYKILPALAHPKTSAEPPSASLRSDGRLQRVAIIPPADFEIFSPPEITHTPFDRLYRRQFYDILPRWELSLFKYNASDEDWSILFSHSGPMAPIEEYRRQILFQYEAPPPPPPGSGSKKSQQNLDTSSPNPKLSEMWEKTMLNTLSLVLPKNFDWNTKNVGNYSNWLLRRKKPRGTRATYVPPEWRRKTSYPYYKVTLSKSLRKDKTFTLSQWFLDRHNENIKREEKFWNAVKQFRKVYTATKTMFPNYSMYNISLGIPNHALGAIFDETEKKLLYFNSNPPFFSTNNELIKFFLSEVIKDSEWSLMWNTTHFQQFSASCGLHSLGFFWYGCCNSYETIARFWNQQESSGSRNSEEEEFLTHFVEILVNQITEFTRFVLQSCIRHCDHESHFKDLYTSEEMDGESYFDLRELIEIFLNCDLSQVELRKQIHNLIPITRFFNRAFGLNLGVN